MKSGVLIEKIIMTTEDYVSFEIAKLLKEKGFNEYGFAAYSKNCEDFITAGPIKNSDIKEDDERFFVTAPTLQMAMKWLREKHNIHITIDCDICDSFDFYSIIRIKSEESWKTYVEYEDEGSNTYEEAVEKVIEYCLTNLI